MTNQWLATASAVDPETGIETSLKEVSLGEAESPFSILYRLQNKLQYAKIPLENLTHFEVRRA